VWPVPGDCSRLIGSPAVLPLGDQAGTAEVSLDEAAQRFDELSELPLQWSDGTATELSLDATLVGAMCVSPGQTGSDEDGLWYAVSVAAETSDGRLEGSYQALVSVYPHYASLSVAQDGLSAQMAATQTGLNGVDFSEVEQTSFNLMLAWDEATGYWGSLDAWSTGDSEECGRELGPATPDAADTPEAQSGSEQSGSEQPGAEPSGLDCYVELERAIIGIGSQGIAEMPDTER
jgi:hypothetical protein